jgi:hypothetical protein
MKEGIRHEACNTHGSEKWSSAQGFGCEAEKQKYPFIKLDICRTILKGILNKENG